MSRRTCASTRCLTPGKFQNQKKVIGTSQRDYLHCSETADNSGEMGRGEERGGESMTKLRTALR